MKVDCKCMNCFHEWETAILPKKEKKETMKVIIDFNEWEYKINSKGNKQLFISIFKEGSVTYQGAVFGKRVDDFLNGFDDMEQEAELNFQYDKKKEVSFMKFYFN